MMDPHQPCRFCMARSDVHIFSRELDIKIKSTLGVVVLQDDALVNLCDDCASKVELFYSFKKMVERSEKDFGMPTLEREVKLPNSSASGVIIKEEPPDVCSSTTTSPPLISTMPSIIPPSTSMPPSISPNMPPNIPSPIPTTGMPMGMPGGIGNWPGIMSYANGMMPGMVIPFYTYVNGQWTVTSGPIPSMVPCSSVFSSAQYSTPLRISTTSVSDKVQVKQEPQPAPEEDGMNEEKTGEGKEGNTEDREEENKREDRKEENKIEDRIEKRKAEDGKQEEKIRNEKEEKKTEDGKPERKAEDGKQEEKIGNEKEEKKNEDGKPERKAEDRKQEEEIGNEKEEKKTEDGKQERKAEDGKQERKAEDREQEEKIGSEKEEKKTEDGKQEKIGDEKEEKKTEDEHEGGGGGDDDDDDDMLTFELINTIDTDSESSEAHSSETRSSETRSSETRSSETRSTETRSSERLRNNPTSRPPTARRGRRGGRGRLRSNSSTEHSGDRTNPPRRITRSSRPGAKRKRVICSSDEDFDPDDPDDPADPDFKLKKFHDDDDDEDDDEDDDDEECDSGQPKKTINTNSGSLECKICKMRFRSEQFYECHMITHASNQDFNCRKCNKSCSTNMELQKHEETNHANETFECKPCLAAFANLKSYRSHVKSHRETARICPYCQQTHASLSLFERHLDSCEKRKKAFEKPQVNDGVNKELTVKKLEPSAGGNKTDAKVLSCFMCSKQFDDQAAITEHMKTHQRSKGPPYPCKHCKEEFKDKGDLICHNAFQHSANPKPMSEALLKPQKKVLKCDKCDKVFGTTGESICHQVLHHKK